MFVSIFGERVDDLIIIVILVISIFGKVCHCDPIGPSNKMILYSLYWLEDNKRTVLRSWLQGVLIVWLSANKVIAAEIPHSFMKQIAALIVHFVIRLPSSYNNGASFSARRTLLIIPLLVFYTCVTLHIIPVPTLMRKISRISWTLVNSENCLGITSCNKQDLCIAVW